MSVGRLTVLRSSIKIFVFRMIGTMFFHTFATLVMIKSKLGKTGYHIKGAV